MGGITTEDYKIFDQWVKDYENGIFLENEDYLTLVSTIKDTSKEYNSFFEFIQDKKDELDKEIEKDINSILSKYKLNGILKKLKYFFTKKISLEDDDYKKIKNKSDKAINNINYLFNELNFSKTNISIDIPGLEIETKLESFYTYLLQEHFENEKGRELAYLTKVFLKLIKEIRKDRYKTIENFKQSYKNIENIIHKEFNLNEKTISVNKIEEISNLLEKELDILNKNIRIFQKNKDFMLNLFDFFTKKEIIGEIKRNNKSKDFVLGSKNIFS